MDNLKISDFTATASGVCFCCSKKEAVSYFKRLGITGETNLCQVKDENGKNFILWINENDKQINFLPLFHEDMFLTLQNVTVVPIEQNVFIYHQRDSESGACYLVLKDTEETLVRQIKLLPDENMIENYCATQGIIPRSIVLCKMFSIKDNRYLMSCWSIYYEDPRELDSYGYPQHYETLLPVDLDDSDTLAEIGLTNVYSQIVKDDETIRVQGKIYRLRRNENGKVFLSKNLFAKSDAETKKQNAEDQKSKCRFIALKQT